MTKYVSIFIKMTKNETEVREKSEKHFLKYFRQKSCAKKYIFSDEHINDCIYLYFSTYFSYPLFMCIYYKRKKVVFLNKRREKRKSFNIFQSWVAFAFTSAYRWVITIVERIFGPKFSIFCITFYLFCFKYIRIFHELYKFLFKI